MVYQAGEGKRTGLLDSNKVRVNKTSAQSASLS